MSEIFKTLSALERYGNELENIKKEYATQVGEISIAWNSLQSIFFTLFFHTTQFELSVCKSIWDTCGMDASQRNLLCSCLGLIKNEDHRLYLKSVLDDASALSAYRNSLIHAVVDIDYDTLKIKPSDINPKKHIDRVNLTVDKNLFDIIKTDITNLRENILVNMVAIFISPHRPLLDKPFPKVYELQIPPSSSANHPDKG